MFATTDQSRHQFSNLCVAGVIQALGIILALLPPHWLTAGIIIAGFGTLLMSGTASIGHLIRGDREPGQLRRSRRNAVIQIGYAVVALSGCVTATLVPPYSVGPGITLAVMATVPLVLGIRMLVAAYGVPLFTAIGNRWTPRVAAITAIGYLAFEIFTAIVFSANTWLSTTAFILCTILMSPFAMNIATMPGPKVLKTCCWISAIPLLAAMGVGGQAAWLSVSGNPAQQCQYVSTEYSNKRGPTSVWYRVRCAGKIFEYDALEKSVDPDDSDSFILVTDSTGIGNPLHPKEIPGLYGTSYYAILGIHTTLILTVIVYSQSRGRQSSFRNREPQ